MTWKRISDASMEPLRATNIGGDGDPEPQKQYGKGRQCQEDGCTTTLSVYNDGDKCWAHSRVPAIAGN